jgi:hypothetical protein
MTTVNPLRRLLCVVAVGVVGACTEGSHRLDDANAGTSGGGGGAHENRGGSGGGAHENRGGSGGTVAGSSGTGTGGSGGAGFGPFPACPSRGGTGGHNFGGAGGGPIICRTSALPDCSGDGPACGDGKADDCLVLASSGSCPKQERRENCDGTDLRGTTCESLGYVSGTLLCTSTCTGLDTTGCRTCTTDPSLLSCGAAPIDAGSMAGTDTEIGLVFKEASATGRIELAFARLSPSLELLGKTQISEEVSPWIERPTIAPLPSGWVVTWYSGIDLVTRALDANGGDLGSMVVANLNQIQQPRAQMVPRPDGGPLVYWWDEGAVVHAAVVAANGRSTTAPFTLPSQDRAPRAATGVYAAGAFHFLMSFSAYGAANVSRNVLTRIAPDGSSSSVDVLPQADLTPETQLVAVNDELRVIYPGQLTCDSPRATLMQRMAADGTALGEPIVIGDGDPVALGPLVFGTDLVSLFAVSGSMPYSTTLNVERVSSSGAPVGLVHTIARGGPGGVSDLLMIRRGPDAVVGWHTSYGMQLARVTP